MIESCRIKVFLSSPGDVNEERRKVSEVVESINKNEGRDNRVPYFIDLYRWEEDLKSNWHSPQENINKELAEIDVLIVILWKRFGTPTSHFGSGTEEEFELMCRRFQESGKPELIFFRCTRDIPAKELDTEQYKRVGGFFAAHHNITVKEYKDVAAFERVVREHLIQKINRVLKERESAVSVIGMIKRDIEDLQKIGITKIYTPERNDERNADKIDFLQNEEGEIYLLALSGHSFLNPGDLSKPAIFFEHVLKRLTGNPAYRFKIILLNPYSLEARKISYAENFKKDASISDIKVEQIKSGKNYRRFNKCLEGIEYIRKRMGDNRDNLEVKISNIATDGTILMSKNRLFYEPYISSRFLTRIRKGLNVFEIQIKNLLQRECSNIFSKTQCEDCPEEDRCENNLYKTISEQFHLLWNTSIPVNEYRNQISKYEDDFAKNHPRLFENQITQLHDSWFAFDPIIGCRGNCSYCFLAPQGWANTPPILRSSIFRDKESRNFIASEYKNLTEYPLFKRYSILKNDDLGGLARVPISIGNKTDMLLKGNKQYLMEFLSRHNEEQTGIPDESRIPIVIITKQLITVDFLKEIRNFSYPLYIFCSISFLDKKYEPNVPSFEDRIEYVRQAKDYIRTNQIENISFVHYWRPISNLMLNQEEGDTRGQVAGFIKQLKDIFDCSIVVGLKITPQMYHKIKGNDKHCLHAYMTKKTEEMGLFEQNMPEEGVEVFEPSHEIIVQCAGDFEYPIFRHTSCAVSYLQNKADYNGTMWRGDICPPHSYCPERQQELCREFKKNWDYGKFKNEITALSNTNVINHDDCIEIIDEPVSQENLNSLTHIFGKAAFSKSIRFSLVWPGSNQKYFWNKYGRRPQY